MTIIGALRALSSTVLEAVFPIPQAEREVLSVNPERAFSVLPRARQFPVAEACSIFSYGDERTRRLIWALKYKKSRRAAEIAGFALFEILSLYSRAAGEISVVPMPITRRRRRERGYNQCELLVDAIEKHALIGEPDSGPFMTIRRDLLMRIRHTSRQTLKDRSERLQDVRDLFAVDENAAGRISAHADNLIIVVDDVVTTGTTIKNAVLTLRRAGFMNTFGLSVAH